ncbi:MAG: S41 family peptidase [Bacteroidetes bacterium]|nr:S41 family peptidase [Bacteroidota bacterium]
MENRPNRIYVYLPFLLAIFLVTGLYLGMKLQNPSLERNPTFSDTSRDKLGNVVHYIKQDYVDSVNKDKLEVDAINGMLRNLDPHSQYISSEELKEVNEPLKGNFEGIGVEFRIIKDTIVILHVIPGGPSEKIGLNQGDRIVKIDDTTYAGVKIANSDVIKHLKGEKGTKVKVSILRQNVPHLMDFIITRDIIPLYSIDVSYMVDGSIGYIKLSRFSASTPEEFDAALAKLEGQGMTRLILDLRDNVGGYLESAIRLADEFLGNRKLIVYTEGNNRPRQYAFASNRGKFEKQPLVILVDEGSASASEILAGAIQDNDRGLIIGRRSFGKGLVQEQIELSDGSALRLTVARYYTPTGRCIQKPYRDGIEQYENEFRNRFHNGELQHPDSIRFPDSLKYTTPGGKVVYGGGGIMPDIYVPIQTGKEYIYYNQLINKGIFYQFAFDYTDNKRENIKGIYPSVDVYIKNFSIDNPLLTDFITYAEEDSVRRDDAGVRATSDLIKTLLKAFIGREIYSDEAFYPIYNQSDTIFLKAVEELSKN